MSVFYNVCCLVSERETGPNAPPQTSFPDSLSAVDTQLPNVRVSARSASLWARVTSRDVKERDTVSESHGDLGAGRLLSSGCQGVGHVTMFSLVISRPGTLLPLGRSGSKTH